MKKPHINLNLKFNLRNASNQSKKIGLAPGSVIYTGKKQKEPVSIFVTDFDETGVERREIESIRKLPEQSLQKRWIQIKGIHNVEFLNEIGNVFNIHALTLEDIANTQHPASIEVFEDSIFVIVKMLIFDPENKRLHLEHVSFMIKHGLLISFQQADAVLFDPILKRLENPKAWMRKYEIDYFLYAMIDLVVDHYFPVMDALNDRFENLEEEVVDHPQKSHVESIHHLKSQLILFRKSVRPLQEVVNLLMMSHHDLITNQIDIFLRDLYGHINQVISLLETQRDLSSGLMDTYLSQVSHRMNEVMKVLTIISTIFIPLGFLAGLYGMNFDVMPELHYPYSYFILLGIMFLIVSGMLLFFRHKRWLK